MSFVIPAKAEIHGPIIEMRTFPKDRWAPACAGATDKASRANVPFHGIVFFVLCFFLRTSPAFACDFPGPLEPFHYSGVNKGAVLERKDGAPGVLAGLELPLDDPLHLERARERIAAWGASPGAVIYPLSDKPGRYGRIEVHAAGREWLQGILLREGLARVSGATELCLAEMLALEEKARRAGKGIWGEARYAPQRAEAVDAPLGSFQLVEGRIVSANRRGRVLYLNFSHEWRTDFTGRVEGGAVAPLDAMGLAGKTVRLRGWLEEWNGPMIRIIHPAQVEVLPQK